jgi:uncharacterized surface protein with fasciclin (FAS1) repeats
MKKVISLLTVLTFIFAYNVVAASNCGSDHGASDSSEKASSKSDYTKKDKMDNKDIVDTAIGAGSFNTLVTAVKAAGLVETLKGEGPLTVFAPTDEAFDKLPEGTVEALLKDKEKLTAILTYHVVPGAVKANDVVKLEKAETLNGQSISIKVNEGTVMVDEATVVATDIICSNGVIHVIDNVIMPEMD